MSDQLPAVSCHCPIAAGMSFPELRELGAGCTDPRYCCPTLAKVRERARKSWREPDSQPQVEVETSPPAYDPFASQRLKST